MIIKDLKKVIELLGFLFFGLSIVIKVIRDFYVLVLDIK